MKRLLTSLGVGIALLTLAACGAGGSPASGSSNAGTSTQTKVTVGQAMKSSEGETVTVLSFKRSFATGNQFEAPAAGNEFVQVTYALFNGSNAEWTLPLSELGLVDANGQKYSIAFAAPQSNVDSLIAGGKAPKVTQVYEVPKGAAVDVTWTPNMFESTVFQTPLV